MTNLLLVSTLDPPTEVLERLRGLGYSVDLVKVPALHPTSITWQDLCRIPRDKVEWADYVILPGATQLGSGQCSMLAGKTVRGPHSIYALPDILRFASPQELSLDRPAEEAIGSKLGLVIASVLRETREAAEGLCRGGACIPLKPPPITVFSEVYRGRVEPRFAAGADLVIVGSKNRRFVEDALDTGKPIGVDAGHDLDFMEWALDVGAVLGMSLTMDTLDGVPRRLREEKVFVVIPRELRSPESRALELEKALDRARLLGYNGIILDPVLQPLVNPGALDGFLAARMLGGLEAPVMVGINNVYELIDADSTGVIPTLTMMAAEAGVSVILVSEESWKSRGATLEARIAADMASLAMRWKMPPKSIGLSLLVAKEKRGHEW